MKKLDNIDVSIGRLQIRTDREGGVSKSTIKIDGRTIGGVKRIVLIGDAKDTHWKINISLSPSMPKTSPVGSSSSKRR